MDDKISWQGLFISVRSRTRLLRPFDEQAHACLGHPPKINGAIGDKGREFLAGIGSD